MQNHKRSKSVADRVLAVLQTIMANPGIYYGDLFEKHGLERRTGFRYVKRIQKFFDVRSDDGRYTFHGPK